MKTMLLFFLVGASMVAILCAIWMFQETTIRVSNSPDERYSIAVIRRSLNVLPVMPGQSSDVECFVELRKENKQVIIRKDVDMVQDIEQIQWGDREVWINPHCAISYDGKIIGDW